MIVLYKTLQIRIWFCIFFLYKKNKTPLLKHPRSLNCSIRGRARAPRQKKFAATVTRPVGRNGVIPTIVEHQPNHSTGTINTHIRKSNNTYNITFLREKCFSYANNAYPLAALAWLEKKGTKRPPPSEGTKGERQATRQRAVAQFAHTNASAGRGCMLADL